ncbi:MAG: isoprenylcysteine carboxyl methyltransferase [Chloroflexota bacterium]|nr:MAG: isoprenylcysteine carboxyl methyltransferase [Chloroflexota bacterium]
MVTRWVFAGLVGALALQRLAEVRHSRRNEAYILSKGGREHARPHFKKMVLLHSAWFAAMLAEVYLLARPFTPSLAAGAALLLVGGQFLRYAAIRTLGRRWTVRVMTLPGASPVNRGIYRYIRHPNYAGVALEIAAVPLLHGAFLTATVFSIANAWVLRERIMLEENALEQDNQYGSQFKNRPRFIPSMPVENQFEPRIHRDN